MLALTFVFLLISWPPAEAQSRRAKTEPQEQTSEKPDDFLSLFKKKSADEKASSEADAKAARKANYRKLKDQHKDARAEVRVSRKDRKAAEAREEAARARAAVTRAKKRAARAEKRADKADSRAVKARKKNTY